VPVTKWLDLFQDSDLLGFRDGEREETKEERTTELVSTSAFREKNQVCTNLASGFCGL